MARTGATQEGIESTIKSPSWALAGLSNRGSATTACTMQSVAERTSGSVAAIFCCDERFAEAAALSSGSVATFSGNGDHSAVPRSGARIMRYPSPEPYRHKGGARRRSILNFYGVA